MTVFDHPWPALQHAAQLWPDAEALVFPHQAARRSFAAYHDEAARLAAGLAALGLKAGDHIALLAENRVEWPIVQMACAALGAVFVPLNTHYRRDDLAFALLQSDARALICSKSYRGNPYLEHVTALRGSLPLLQHVLTLEDDFDRLVQAPPLASGADGPSATAALLYTSGTTGFPKGALLTHRAMMMDARGAAQRLGVSPGDRWTSIIPLFHCAGCIMNVLGALQSGATYAGVPSFDPEGMFKIIESEGCTVLSGVPTSYLAMLDHPARRHFDLSSLRAGSCGGADADPAMLERCARDFPIPGLCQVYGQTEGSTLFVCPKSDDPLRWETAGTALPGYDLRVVDPVTRDEMPAGEIGEIQARGPMVMQGYYKRPDETAETFAGEWLRTGDLGLLRPDGRLVIAGGRLRDMIIRGGENIYPAEIEHVLQSHDGVAAVAVFGLPDAYYGEIVAAAVKPSGNVTAEDLRALCAGRIAKFKVPATIFRADAFPLTPSGKIRKVELRKLAEGGQLAMLP